MIAPARVAAYDAGLTLSAARADLPDMLAASRLALQDERDKTLAAEIIIGVQRWRAALDQLIVHFSRRAIEKLDPEIVEILRLSLYQLLHLTRVPASAIVDDAVKMTGRVGKRSASGLVNAVLRAMSRSRHRGTGADATYGVLPPRPSDPHQRETALAYLSITLSHPRWLVERWLDRYGFDATEQWLMYNNRPAPLTLRANELRITSDELIRRLEHEDVVVRRGRYVPDALIVEHGRPLATDGFEDGSYVVQDEASQLVTLLAGADPGRRVLDACASPGGKATALAARIAGGALLVASDVRERRMALLKRTVAASGAGNVRLLQADLLAPLPFARAFDCVFVDAPCSGLGTLRRDPDIKWRRRERDLPALAAAQLTMLRHAAEGVRAGGRLIYATCSSEPDENEEVVAMFLASAPSFARISAADAAPSLAPLVIDANGHLRTYPHEHGLDAFFGAVFKSLDP